MQHIEFFHKDHFEYRYHRKKAKAALSRYIDFFWETDFESLWSEYPQGFSDALFPNVGYTYLINLGTPFVMQLEEEKFEIRSDAFLPRHKNMICHHATGNKIFGIKFKISPIIFEKKINFFEYREFIYPLAYLIDRKIIEKIKEAESFNKRVEVISAYYERIIEKHEDSLKHVSIVTRAFEAFESSNYRLSIEAIAEEHGISTRTLQRYFEATTSVSTKQAFQILRIRKAVEKLITDAAGFDHQVFGYYDYSHFYKQLKEFINNHPVCISHPHLLLLKGIE